MDYWAQWLIIGSYSVAQGLYSASQGLYFAAQGLYSADKGCRCSTTRYMQCMAVGWPSTGTTGIQAIRPKDGNIMVPGAHTYILQTADCRMQDTNYSVQACRHRSIRRCKDTRMNRIQDAGIIRRFAAWWPLYRGAGGFMFI